MSEISIWGMPDCYVHDFCFYHTLIWITSSGLIHGCEFIWVAQIRFTLSVRQELHNTFFTKFMVMFGTLRKQSIFSFE